MSDTEILAYTDSRITELEKENAKLKNTLKDWDIWEEGRKKEIAELEKENAELKEELHQKSDTNHSLVEQLADKEIIISELKAQIEKMKGHENCKYRHMSIMDFPFGEYPCTNCSDLDKWELAE